MRLYYERDVVHPATMRWLVDHHYFYQYEPSLPFRDGAIYPDFLAWIPTERNQRRDYLIVECKPSFSKAPGAIRQLRLYASALGIPAQKCIALPDYEVTEVRSRHYLSHGITLLSVPVSTTRRQYELRTTIV